jgi:hypothetical protein
LTKRLSVILSNIFCISPEISLKKCPKTHKKIHIYGEEGISMAGQVMLTISKDEHEYARKMTLEKSILDTKSHLLQAKREGETRGIQIGEKRGEARAARLFTQEKTAMQQEIDRLKQEIVSLKQ